MTENHIFPSKGKSQNIPDNSQVNSRLAFDTDLVRIATCPAGWSPNTVLPLHPIHFFQHRISQHI